MNLEGEAKKAEVSWGTEKKARAFFFDRHESLQSIKQKFFSPAPVFSLEQIHSAEVHTITALGGNQPQGDALVSVLDGVALAVHTADCLPLLGAGDGVIGACHGGWRGVAGGILENWITAMSSLGAEKNNICIAIGPAIGPCHFEVGVDVANQIAPGISEQFSLPHEDPQKRFFDLKKYAVYSLQNLGIRLENILVSPQCTFCDSARFFSYRRNNKESGRLEAVITKSK